MEKWEEDICITRLKNYSVDQTNRDLFFWDEENVVL